MGDRDLERVPDPDEHDVEAEPQRFGGIALVGIGQHHAGVGDDGVDVTELFNARVERLLQGSIVADVRLAEKHFLPGLFHQASRLLEVLVAAQLVGHDLKVFTDVDSDDVRTLLGAHDRVRATLPAGGAGDEDDPAVE